VSRVLTAAQIEAAAQEGWRELAVADGTVVTPLARDRAVALGLALVSAVASGAVGAPAEDDLPSAHDPQARYLDRYRHSALQGSGTGVRPRGQTPEERLFRHCRG